MIIVFHFVPQRYYIYNRLSFLFDTFDYDYEYIIIGWSSFIYTSSLRRQFLILDSRLS